MSLVHLHLLMNHIPVIGALFVVALLATALLRRDGLIARTALSTSAILGVVAIAVYFTGEPAEEAVEHLPGVSKSAIEQHEEMALVATVMIAACGALALGALMMFRGRRMPQWVVVSSFVGMLAVAGVMGWTANLGGQIRHTELRGAGRGARVAGSGEEDHEWPLSASAAPLFRSSRLARATDPSHICRNSAVHAAVELRHKARGST
jgi:hypothetical protein